MSIEGEPSLPAGAGEIHPAETQRPATENFFVGPNGMRAGWRLLLFIFLMILRLEGEGFTLKHIPGVDAWFKPQNPNGMTPTTTISFEGISLFALVISEMPSKDIVVVGVITFGFCALNHASTPGICFSVNPSPFRHRIIRKINSSSRHPARIPFGPTKKFSVAGRCVSAG